MKVAVLGATGSTGLLVVSRLLTNNHEVVAVSRSGMPDHAAASRLSQRVGDMTDASFLRDAIAGTAAVISCLGQRHASKSLFSRRTSPPDILRRVKAATIEAIGDGPQHYIYMSAFGVGADRRKHALLFRIILRLSSIHEAYLDHAAAEARITSSHKRWTIIRPPGLTDADEEVTLVDKGDKWSSFEMVSKRSVAAFMVTCAERGKPLHRTITIGKPKR